MGLRGGGSVGDWELAGKLQRAMEKEGVVFRLGAGVEGVEVQKVRVHLSLKGGENLVAEKVLVAVGRVPALEGLGLEKAGITFDRRGIKVNQSCRTNVNHTYAMGVGGGRAAFT